MIDKSMIASKKALAGKALGAKVATGGETGFDKAKHVAKKLSGPIAATSKAMAKITLGLLRTIGKMDIAAEGVVRMLDFQEQLRFSIDHNLKMNQVSIEVMAIQLRRANKDFELDMDQYLGILSFENFNGSEIKYTNYSQMSMEGIGEFISKMINKVKEFFAKIWNSIKDGFSKTVDFVGFLKQKFEAYEAITDSLKDLKKDSFKANKKILKLIPSGDDYTFSTIQDQYGVQVDAFGKVDKFTKQISSDIKKYESEYRKDSSEALTKLAEQLGKLRDYSFGKPDQPLADFVYYKIVIENEGEKHVRLIFNEEKPTLISKKDAVCKPLTGGEIDSLITKLRTLVGTADAAFNTYHSLYNEVNSAVKKATSDTKKINDKHDAKMAKVYLELYNGIYAMCPAMSYIIVSTNLFYIEGCMSYIDETIKCYEE